jgi:hypothetical protein
MRLKKPPTTMRHSLNDLHYTPPISLYCSPSRQCFEFVMKPPTYEPTQNLVWVPSSRITALCSPFSPATPILGNEQYLPQGARNQASQPEGQSDFIDGSGPIFSMYMEMAEGEDKKMTESWKADADSILVFVRLYLLVSCFTLNPRS